MENTKQAIDLNNIKQAHFIGIGGKGMSALAHLLIQRGVFVTGSDIERGESVRHLEAEGAEIAIGHSADNFATPDLVIYSDAIAPENPEREKAESLNLTLCRRSELLGLVMKDFRGVAITGTHGKTTTTGLVGLTVIDAGFDPTVLIGGDFSEIGGNSHVGRGNILITEACEAFNGFLDLSPELALITNFDIDHLHFHGTEEKLRGNFKTFVQRMPTDGHLFLWAEDSFTPELENVSPCKVTKFGLSEKANIRAVNIKQNGQKTEFELIQNDLSLGVFSLRIPGQHNLLNALGAAALCLHMGITPKDIKHSFEIFIGAQRRLEVIDVVNGITVIDDFAHHPTEISASLTALKEVYSDKNIIAIFQPHLYTRTRDFLQKYIEVLNLADEIVVTDIYPAREKPIPGVGSALVTDGFHASGTGKRCDFVPNMRRIPKFLAPRLTNNDIVVTLGCGNIGEIAYELVDELKRRKKLKTRKMKVAVLLGGDSPEREISLSTGREVLSGLDKKKFDAVGIDPSLLNGGKVGYKGIIDLLTDYKPDVAFLALHGEKGEDGCIQGLLEIAGIPYTGSGVTVSAVAMDKELTKIVLERSGLTVPKGVKITQNLLAQTNLTQLTQNMKLPYIVKPNTLGSTIGLTRVYKECELENAVAKALAYDSSVLIEELVEGTEISVSVIGNNNPIALPIVEIIPQDGFYDFSAKYKPGATTEICPARLSDSQTKKAMETAISAFTSVGCKGCARVDIIVNNDIMTILEINTIPGLTPTSLVPKAALTAGIAFPQLLEKIIDLALEGK